MKPLSIALFLLPATMAAAELGFSGGNSPVAVVPPASTGLEKVYVLENADGMIVSYTATTDRQVSWLRFGNAGGAYAEDIAVDRDGRTTSLRLGADDCGFIIEEGTDRHFFWVVNYARHQFVLDAVEVSPESDCGSTMLITHGEGAQILYYSITGVPTELSREITIEYNTLEYDESIENFRQVSTEQKINHLTSEIHVMAPLCDTRFDVTGDRFLQAWGRGVSVESEIYSAIAVEGHTSAEQAEREIDNESHFDVNGLGGSAPVDITFTAVVTDAVRFTEWQFSRDPNFDTYDLRFSDTEVSYTFTDAGVTYVRFQASNNAGTCDWFSEVYEVSVGDSKLLCPNAFSPNDDGVNDIWKVSYRSIVEFDCTIFNRWGTQIIHLTDPSQGWDGKVGGKTAPSGVYYYVIKARGADGYKYNLSGDINIINYSQKPGTSAPTE